MTRYLSLLLIMLFLIAVPITLAQDDGDEDTGSEIEIDLPLTESITYSIQAGDTLDVLASTFDIQLACLREVNDLAPADILQPGDIIRVDLGCPKYDGTRQVEFPRELDVDEGTYIVQRGDTLDTIAQELDISLEALALANGIGDVGDIEIGQVLEIPEDAPPYGEVPAADLDGNDFDSEVIDDDEFDDNDVNIGQGGGGGETYVIQRGDTLDVIAQERNISLVSLQLVNDISNGRSLMPGMTIIIPADAPPYGAYPAIGTEQGGGFDGDGDLYVVQPRDTLDEIGQELNVSVVSLLLVNNLERGIDLRPGMTIFIPSDAPAYGQVPALDGGDGQGGGFSVDGEVYVIQPRETVDGISARFDKAPSCVLEANNITNARRVTAGTTIIIPDSCPAYDGYDIVPGR